MNFVLTMMNFALTMMNFALKTMNFALKTMNFALKGGTVNGSCVSINIHAKIRPVIRRKTMPMLTGVNTPIGWRPQIVLPVF